MRAFARSRFGLCAALLLLAYASCFALGDVLYSNPVMAGDYPDPTIIRVGDTFYVSSTSAEWGPQFPILQSTDLVNWSPAGFIFPTRPTWTFQEFWAPELSFWNNKFWCYYAAYMTPSGPLAVAAASADNVLGPWTDHGPVVAQSTGSIDAMAITDEEGVRWLIWKQDSNSVHMPTWIWAQQLAQNGSTLIGERYSLIRNDAAWEGDVVEGPFMLYKDGYYWLFFAGNNCCGAGCNYGTGVARSKSVQGPWEKCPRNPILYHNEYITCPGHGSIVVDQQGRYFFAHHGYPTTSTNNPEPFIFTGRQLMVDEVTWAADGWPIINNNQGTNWNASSPFGAPQKNAEWSIYDNFAGSSLAHQWVYPAINKPTAVVNNGLTLTANVSAPAGNLTGVLGQTATKVNYTSITNVTVAGGSNAGLVAYGDENNSLGVTVNSRGDVTLWTFQNAVYTEFASSNVGSNVNFFLLKLICRSGYLYSFEVSANSTGFQPIGSTPLDGSYLPPWDRGIRVSLTVGGQQAATAHFASFTLDPY